MASYVFIPGAGGEAWYWQGVVPLLDARGHQAIPVVLPAGDDSAGWREYAETVVAAIGDRRDLILVAQSLGGFTAPLVCERVPVQLLVLLNAMIPKPGETGGDWWSNTGQGEPQQSWTPMTQPWPLDAWPDVPTRAVAGRDDRLFPVEFQRRVARERLGIEADVLDGGHLLMLSQPDALVELLERYRAGLRPSPAAA